MSTTTLLPCPFCGQQPTEYAIEPHTHVLQFAGGKMPDHQGSHVIECACGCGMIEATREAVAAVWNRRPASSTTIAVRLEIDTEVKELMGLVNDIQKNRVCAEMSPSNKDHFNDRATESAKAVELKLRNLLAELPATAAQPDRKYICPVRSIADLVNNLMLMDQALPIYGAQYIEHPAGRRRAIAVPPTVSIERVKDSRWIGEGEALNTAIVWTRAEQPVVPLAQAGARDARIYTYSQQPTDNVIAWRIGEACSKARPGGDYIDHGLSLLQQLQEKGYGITAIATLNEQGVK